MKNYGIRNFKYANVDTFTSDIGIKLRRGINPVLRPILKAATNGKVIIENYPELEDGKPYIFASTHNFVEDSIANLGSIDRNAYLLFGTSDQLEVNKDMYFAWLNGFIYVDRKDDSNRKDALNKMERLLESGTSVLIFPEGGFNNTENLLSQKLFASPYILAKRTGVKVVPVAPFNEFGSKNIYMNYGKPIDFSNVKSKDEGKRILRDELATLLWENMERNAPRVKRNELGVDPRLDYMEERRQAYLKTKWTKDVFDEELTRYYDKDDKELMSIMDDIDKIDVNEKNAGIIAPVLVRKRENEKYDFKEYMHKNWNKR